MRRAKYYLHAVLLTLAVAAPSLAQVTEPEAEPKSYVPSYFIVGLGVALGIISVCRMSKRRKEVRKPE